MRELFKKPVVYVMHDKIDKEGHDQSAIEMTKACRETIKDLAALVHSIHMSYNVADVYITSDHGFLFEDKKFEEKDKHQVQEDNVDKKTRYY
jgi:phosphoenolpyruvate-protein kinase (PTS system EI component)